MKSAFWKLIVVAAVAISLGIAPAVNADDELPVVSGTVEAVYRDISTIVISSESDGYVTIVGFPFNNLEAQLENEFDPEGLDADDITIAVGDCVTIEYSEKILPSTGDVVNKWESLTAYCENCTDCYEGELTRKPIKQKDRPKPDKPKPEGPKAGPWDGNPPGHCR